MNGGILVFDPDYPSITLSFPVGRAVGADGRFTQRMPTISSTSAMVPVVITAICISIDTAGD